MSFYVNKCCFNDVNVILEFIVNYRAQVYPVKKEDISSIINVYGQFIFISWNCACLYKFDCRENFSGGIPSLIFEFSVM